MEKKERKLPNKIEDKDNPIQIPTGSIFNGGLTFPERKYVNLKLDEVSYPVTNFTYTSSIPEGFTPSVPLNPQTYRLESEIANLKQKAREVLNHHYSVGKIAMEFGNSKFPKRVAIECNKCFGFRVQYIVDFFVHCIADHGNSLNSTVHAFNSVLDRIAAR